MATASGAYLPSVSPISLIRRSNNKGGFKEGMTGENLTLPYREEKGGPESPLGGSTLEDTIRQKCWDERELSN